MKSSLTSSQKAPPDASPTATRVSGSARGSKSRRVLASALPTGSEEQTRLALHRRIRDLCMECGAPREGTSDYCGRCLGGFPIRTEVAFAVGGWRYEVWQMRPSYDAPAFHAMRVGIFEYERRGAQLIGAGETFEVAKELCEKRQDRAFRALGVW
jgi:hypothetical protein